MDGESAVLSGMEPAGCWRHFEALTRISRPSLYEDQAIEHARAWAAPALAVCHRVYQRLFGAAPIVTAVHAWLETAVIGERVPGLDMVSFGPQIDAPHSPDERVSISAVERFWRLLTGTVDELSAEPG
jgi:di/tripeptidase